LSIQIVEGGVDDAVVVEVGTSVVVVVVVDVVVDKIVDCAVVDDSIDVDDVEVEEDSKVVTGVWAVPVYFLLITSFLGLMVGLRVFDFFVRMGLADGEFVGCDVSTITSTDDIGIVAPLILIEVC